MVNAKRVTVTTSPTAILSNSPGPAIIKSSADVYLGGADVTTSTGFLLAAGDIISDLELTPSETLYGIVASSTATVSVLTNKRGAC